MDLIHPQGLLLMSLVVTVVNLINLVVLEVSLLHSHLLYLLTVTALHCCSISMQCSLVSGTIVHSVNLSFRYCSVHSGLCSTHQCWWLSLRSCSVLGTLQ